MTSEEKIYLKSWNWYTPLLLEEIKSLLPGDRFHKLCALHGYDDVDALEIIENIE